jgi:uncharacterized protein YgbK (DUF1537 family)
MIKASDRCIIVLDDDPTGCQTLHGIPVLFRWDLDILVPDDRPDIKYIVFAGNVGENDALSLLFNKLN